MEKLLENINKADVAHYLTSNPFSGLANANLNGCLTKELFFTHFHVQSLMMCARMAAIFSVSMSTRKNTIFVTGFKGCGKTTFANFIIEVLTGSRKIILLDEADIYRRKTRLADLNDRYKENQLNTYLEHFELMDLKEYESQLIEISEDIEKKLYEITRPDMEECSEKINHYINYINQRIEGRTIYLNFEEGINNSSFPVEQKLNEYLRKSIKKIISESRNAIVFEPLTKAYEEIDDDVFERKADDHVREIMRFFREELCPCDDYNKIKSTLKKKIAPMKIDQLLLLIVLTDVFYSDAVGDNKNLFYIFDNLDIFYDNKALDDFVDLYSVFITNFNGILTEISKTTHLKIKRNLYENINFIFFMRETTAMMISQHHRGRVLNYSDPFEMSTDSDKGSILDKKRNFVFDNRQSINDSLYDLIERNYTICTDQYIKNNLFTMFNNDYDKAIECIADISKSQSKYIIEYSKFIETKKQYSMVGARGIIFRLIFNYFMDKRYYEKIGVNSIRNSRFDYTPSRLVLFYMNSIQARHISNFLLDGEDTITLDSLKNDFTEIYNDTIDKQDVLYESLNGMFFRMIEETSWSHLVTFDALDTVSLDTIKKYLDGDTSLTLKSKIHVRITCAGRNYVRFMCSEFEFFACRFAQKSKPLFSEESSMWDESKKKYKFEDTLEKVLSAVENCCEKLDNLNRHIFCEDTNYTREQIFASPFIYQYKAPDKEISMFHEERIIHKHINYIDSYRLFLINEKYPENVTTINEKIMPILKKYVTLLDRDIYCDTSKEMYVELTYCIDGIYETECTDRTIQVSRTGYNQLVKKNKTRPTVSIKEISNESE